MVYQSRRDDEWDDDPAWDESDEDDGDDEHDDDDTVPCPYCRRQVYEDAEHCPYCERYLSGEDAPPTRKPWWVIVTALVCLYIAIRWVIG